MTKEELIETQLQAMIIFAANDHMMDVKECAKFLRCNERTVTNRIKSNNKHNKIIAEYKGGWRIPKLQFYKKLIKEFDNTRSTSLKAV
nr:hypothetical protein [uncultured Allomuricauda sp.]